MRVGIFWWLSKLTWGKQCTPAHHGMSWEDAARKFNRTNSRSNSPMLTSPGGRPVSSSSGQPLTHVLNPESVPQDGQLRVLMAQETDAMDIDGSLDYVTSPGGRHQIGHSHHNSSHHLTDPRLGGSMRTPLPSNQAPVMQPHYGHPQTGQLYASNNNAPHMFAEKPQMALPGIETLGGGIYAGLQTVVDRVVASRNSSRYSAVHVLLLSWQDDAEAEPAVKELLQVFSESYRFDCEAHRIPHDGSWKWLSKVILGGPEEADRRDVLKVVYYNGHTYLDSNREMVLAR